MESYSFFCIFACQNYIVMNKLKYLLYLFAGLISVSIASCDKYDTIVMGQDFAPVNSLVTNFRQLVYVEYCNGKARVWGPCADRVESSVEDSHVMVNSDLDSLVVFAYGYAIEDSLNVFQGSLTVNSTHPYALYLSNLSLRSDEGPAIQSQGSSDCFFVLPPKSQNIIYGDVAFGGSVIFDGEGSLSVESQSGTALSARGSITCSYPVVVSLMSGSADGIHSDNGNIKIADGTWTIAASRHAFSTAAGQVILNGGKIQASAKGGSFVSSVGGKGLVASGTSCVGVSALKSDVDEDMRQFVWQVEMSDLMLDADSLVTIMRDPNFAGNPVPLTTFTPAFSFQSPWVLVSDSLVTEVDDVIISAN